MQPGLTRGLLLWCLLASPLSRRWVCDVAHPVVPWGVQRCLRLQVPGPDPKNKNNKTKEIRGFGAQLWAVCARARMPHAAHPLQLGNWTLEGPSSLLRHSCQAGRHRL